MKSINCTIALVSIALPVFAQDPDPLQGIAQIKDEARRLQEIVSSTQGKEFLAATGRLPQFKPRRLYRNDTTRRYYSPASAERLSEDERGKLSEVTVDDQLFYMTKFGTPMAYVRTLELYAQVKDGSLSGRKVLDFGYGTIGQLQLMALAGADTVGVDIDPLFVELYSEPGDQGTVVNKDGRNGSVRIIDGRLPSIADQVGGGYDLITSKNTLKNGFFHPERPVPKSRLMDLGVDDETFVKTIYDALKPGGVFLIYNICPAPSKPDEPYKHWADGRCPFPRKMFEKAGFKVLEYDTNDNRETRRLARTLGWDQGQYKMDLENDLYGSYTIVIKNE